MNGRNMRENIPERRGCQLSRKYGSPTSYVMEQGRDGQLALTVWVGDNGGGQNELQVACSIKGDNYFERQAAGALLKGKGKRLAGQGL